MKRRAKITNHHQNERGAVGLVFAVLILASAKWHRVPMTPLERALLKNIRDLMCPEKIESQFISSRNAA